MIFENEFYLLCSGCGGKFGIDKIELNLMVHDIQEKVYK